MPDFIGLLASNYQNTTVLDYQQCTNMGQSALLHVNADLILVLARPFQSQTILFQCNNAAVFLFSQC